MISDSSLHAIGMSYKAIFLFGPLVRGVVLVACLWLSIVQVGVYMNIASATIATRDMQDFGTFYRSSESVALGLSDPYDDGHPNLNPPHMVLLLVPIAWFSPGVALVIWGLLSLCSAGLALWIVFREAHIALTPTAIAWTLVAILMAAPTGALLSAAQMSWLLWGPITWAWSRARHRRWNAAAVILGVLVSVKPFLGLFFLTLAITRRWRAAGIAFLTSIGCLGLGIVALGWPTFLVWIRLLRSIGWTGHVLNASLYGFLERGFGDRPLPGWELSSIGHLPWLVVPLWITGALVIVGLSVFVLRRASRDGGNDHSTVDGLFAVTLAASLLLSPLGWIYYLFLLVGPAVALFSDTTRRARWRLVALAAVAIAFMAPPGVLTLAQPSGFSTVSLGSMYFWGLACLWASLLGDSHCAPQPAGS